MARFAVRNLTKVVAPGVKPVDAVSFDVADKEFGHTPRGVWSPLNRRPCSAAMKTFVMLAAILCLATQSPAKVLIFKGSVRVISDSTTALPKRIGIFEVFDPDQSTTASILTFEADGKNLLVPTPVSDIRFAQAPIFGGKNATLISNVSIVGSTNEFFEHTTIRFRGTNGTLPFSSGITANLVTFPRLLSATAIQDEATAGVGAFIEERGLLSYQQSRSIEANDQNLTLQQVVDGLVAELKTKGFQINPL